MTTSSASQKPKKSWLKLVFFSAACLFLCFLVVGWSLFGHYAVLFFWNSELNDALAVEKNSSEAGKTKVETVFSEATKAKVAPDILMRMHRVYGTFLYGQGEVERGSAQFQKAIEIGTPEPPTNVAVADQLTHAYQDRGWSNHRLWMNDKKVSDGARDQEMSVKVAEKAFGPYHEQTIYKTPSLAAIYADLGRFKEADKLIEHCVDAVETKASAKQCAWYVYMMLARIRAVEHRGKEAIDAYFKCRAVAPHAHVSDKAWEELLTGLRVDYSKKNPDWALARKLLNQGKYAELENIAQTHMKNYAPNWNGYSKIDWMTTAIQGGSEVSEVQYDQLKLDLNSYLAQKPNSSFARTALANLHIYRAWQVQQEDGDRQFDQLIAEARKTMAAAPGMQNKYPNAYVPMMRLTIVERDRESLLKLLEQGNKQWPTAFTISSWGYKFLSPNWVGRNGEKDEYVHKRADTIGGAQGDKFYAQMAWHIYVDLDDGKRLFGKRGKYNWDRVERGFKQIFKEFPDNNEARVAFIRLAFQADREDAARRAFD